MKYRMRREKYHFTGGGKDGYVADVIVGPQRHGFGGWLCDNGRSLYIVRLKRDGQWYLAPNNDGWDWNLNDYGPYPTLAVALTVLRLMGVDFDRGYDG